MIKMYKKVQKGIKGIQSYNFLHLELSYCPDTWEWASRSALISLALWRDLACHSRALFRARSDSWRARKIRRCCLIMRWARTRTAWRWERTWHELHELLGSFQSLLSARVDVHLLWRTRCRTTRLLLNLNKLCPALLGAASVGLLRTHKHARGALPKRTFVGSLWQGTSSPCNSWLHARHVPGT